jgi:tetratricopeptide (TPR) repeat protein
MTATLLLAVLLAGGEAGIPQPPTIASAVLAPELGRKADMSYLIRNWERAIDQYAQLVESNPTVGFYWFRLATCCLETGKYDRAIEAFEKAEELGAFQWNPPRMVHRGEAAWGLAAAHARLGHRDEAVRWTRVSLGQGLRDIRRFQAKHFESVSADAEFKKLIWVVDAKPASRDEGRVQDLRFLLHEMKRIHYAPYRATSEAELDALASSLEEELSRLSDEQFFVRVMRIMRALGDGHSGLRMTGRPVRLPVQLFEYPEGLYVTAALPAQADLVGAKILKIGNRTADEALALTREISSRDNPMTVLSFAPRLLCSSRILRGLGIVEGEGPVPLEVEDASGMTRRVELRPQDIDRAERSWVRAVPGRQEPLPLALRHPDKTYWQEFLPDERLVYCQLNGIGTDTQLPLSEFCKKLFAEVARPEVDALVIDMRFNGGGDTFTNPPLIEGIIRSEKLQNPGRLFVIIGRATFSAAQNTVSELERRTKAIFVGEPSGSRPNFIGESIAIVLPNSGWVASISDLWWQHSMAMDYRIWTPPNLYAPPTAASFRAHTDPAMDAIIGFRKK